MDDMLSGIVNEFTGNAGTVFGQVSHEEVEKGAELILNANNVFVLGIGQTGCIGRILAMKLRHVGLTAYTVFDEINPPLARGDLFVAISQSGETKTIVGLTEKAKELGGRILAVTAHAGSILAEAADVVIQTDARSPGREFPHLSALGDEKHRT